MLNRKNLLLNVYGKVQGVFYRTSAVTVAIEFGVNGTVQNMRDGSVQIEIEGTEEQLKNFIAWCWRGPELSMVTDIKVAEGAIKNFTDFRIIY